MCIGFQTHACKLWLSELRAEFCDSDGARFVPDPLMARDGKLNSDPSDDYIVFELAVSVNTMSAFLRAIHQPIALREDGPKPT